jgi:hypothetical protein
MDFRPSPQLPLLAKIVLAAALLIFTAVIKLIVSIRRLRF